MWCKWELDHGGCYGQLQLLHLIRMYADKSFPNSIISEKFEIPCLQIGTQRQQLPIMVAHIKYALLIGLFFRPSSTEGVGRRAMVSKWM